MLDAITHLTKQDIVNNQVDISKSQAESNTLIMTKNDQLVVITDNETSEEFTFVLNAEDMLVLHSNFYDNYVITMSKIKKLPSLGELLNY